MFKHSSKQLLALLASFLIVLALTSCGGGEENSVDASGTGLQTIRIVPWGPRFIDFIDFYVGDEKGFSAEAGIHLEQLAAEGAGDAVRYVVAGNADIAMADPFSAYFAIQQGADLQGYCPYPKSWMTLVVNSNKGIDKPADLRGKTIAVTSQASTSRYYSMFFLAANGLSEDDVTMASVGRDFASVLLGGSVDAASTWESINWGMFRKMGDPAEQGFQVWEYEQVPGPNDVYFANRDWVEKNHDLVQRFITAIQKSKRWIQANPQAAAELGAKHAVGADDMVRNQTIIDMRIKMQSQGPGVADNGMGWCDIETMQNVVGIAVDSGVLREPIDVARVVTNEFLAENASGQPESSTQ